MSANDVASGRASLASQGDGGLDLRRAARGAHVARSAVHATAAAGRAIEISVLILGRASFGRCLFPLALDRSELREAQLAGAEFAHDLGAAAARVVDPFALAAGARWVPVDTGARRMLNDAGLGADSVGTCSGRSYGTTDVTSEHSPNSRRFCRHRVAGAP
jgi:hypothetical protein